MKEEELNQTMNSTEESPSEIQSEEQTHAEESLPDAHNPDMGEPEEKPVVHETESDLEKSQREAREWKDKYLRLFAEFDNFRKRTIRERVELLGSASGEVIKEILPILDDFDRAVKANENAEEINTVKEGFVLIHQKLYRKLEAKGLKTIDATGKVFDTDFHEAITQIPAPAEEMKGKVVEEIEKGYLLNEKVIRFSKVVIGI